MLPTFLRFDNVQLLYDTNNTKPIEEKCEFIKSQLLPIKLALNGSNMVNFHACIRQENCHFNDHSQLLECIRNRFLPICNSFRGYTFEINFLSDPNTNTTVIASLLKMDELKRCSNILIKLRASVIQSRLPVEEISNWLEKSADGMENIRKNQNERFISIVSVCRLQYCLHALLRKVHAQSLEDGCQEMIDHLKKVDFKI